MEFIQMETYYRKSKARPMAGGNFLNNEQHINCHLYDTNS